MKNTAKDAFAKRLTAAHTAYQMALKSAAKGPRPIPHETVRKLDLLRAAWNRATNFSHSTRVGVHAIPALGADEESDLSPPDFMELARVRARKDGQGIAEAMRGAVRAHPDLYKAWRQSQAPKNPRPSRNLCP